MTKLPASFDHLLVEDQLMATLKNSPLTAQLVPLRAEEIVQLVIQKPICLMLEEQIRQLKHQLEDEKRNKRTMRSDSKRDRVQQKQQHQTTEYTIKKQSEELQGYS